MPLHCTHDIANTRFAGIYQKIKSPQEHVCPFCEFQEKPTRKVARKIAACIVGVMISYESAPKKIGPRQGEEGEEKEEDIFPQEKRQASISPYEKLAKTTKVELLPEREMSVFEQMMEFEWDHLRLILREIDDPRDFISMFSTSYGARKLLENDPRIRQLMFDATFIRAFPRANDKLSYTERLALLRENNPNVAYDDDLDIEFEIGPLFPLFRTMRFINMTPRNSGLETHIENAIKGAARLYNGILKTGKGIEEVLGASFINYGGKITSGDYANVSIMAQTEKNSREEGIDIAVVFIMSNNQKNVFDALKPHYETGLSSDSLALYAAIDVFVVDPEFYSAVIDDIASEMKKSLENERGGRAPVYPRMDYIYLPLAKLYIKTGDERIYETLESWNPMAGIGGTATLEAIKMGLSHVDELTHAHTIVTDTYLVLAAPPISMDPSNKKYEIYLRRHSSAIKVLALFSRRASDLRKKYLRRDPYSLLE